jgi:hypothetical protein
VTVTHGRLVRQVEVRLTGWMIAGAIAELRIWLDQYDCAPRWFEITRAGGCVLLRVEFEDDALAEAFEREFER